MLNILYDNKIIPLQRALNKKHLEKKIENRFHTGSFLLHGPDFLYLTI